MGRNYWTFFFRLVIFSLILIIIGGVLFYFQFRDYYSNDLLIVFALIFFLTAGIYYLLLRSSQQGIQKFATKFVMFQGIKIMLYLIMIVVYSFANPQKAVPFLITFLSLYLLFTSFSTISVLKYIRSTENSQGK